MNRIDELFARKDSNILNIYFTAGYPNLDDTTSIISALDKSGVDMVEIGMPYSDPMADGPTIQESGSVALANGMTLSILFDQLAHIRDHIAMPLLMMGYLNQMMQFGVERFLNKCRAVGIDGLIIPDLPIEIFEKEWKLKIEGSGLHTIFLITPQTASDRIKKIDAVSRGFVYMVSDASITGAKSGISEAQIQYFDRIATMNLQNPRLIGFGISNHHTFNQACQYANGAIIGSAFIKMLASSGGHLTEQIDRFISEIRTG